MVERVALDAVLFCCGDILRKGVELAFRYSVMPGQNFESGSAVRPVILCLSAQGSRHDRSNDRATLDGLKLFRLLRAWFSDRCPLLSFSSRRGPSVIAR